MGKASNKIIQSIIVTSLLIFTFQVHAANSSEKIHFLFTSDIHGWMSTSQLYPKRKHSGLLHLKDQIIRLKHKYDDLILVDAGDLLQGSPAFHYYHHVKKTDVVENPFFKLVNELKYDAVVVGNHDLSLNPKFEAEYVPNSKFSWLAANVYRKGKVVFKPYIVRNHNGVRIVVLGFTTPGIHMWMGPDQLQGIQVESLDKSVKKWTNKVKSKEKPDVLIGVFHVGLNFYRDDENSKLNRVPVANNLRTILTGNKDFDLVVSGHDHQLYPNKNGQEMRYVSGTPVISPGHFGNAALLVEVDLKKQKEQGKIRKMKVSLINSKYHRDIATRLKDNNLTEYNTYLNEALPWFFNDASRKDVQACLNNLLSLSSDEDGLDGTFFPGVSVFGLKQVVGRNLNRADLFRWIRYDNKSVMVNLSRRDIEILAHPKPEYGARKVPYNRVLIPWFKKNFSVEPAGFWLKADSYEKKYCFKLTDYHFWGGGGLKSKLFIKSDDLIKISKKFQRDILFQYLKNAKSLPKTCYFLRYNARQ